MPRERSQEVRGGDGDGAGSEWWKDAVLYHVYPRSFADSDGDGVGDLPGVTSRLDHLAGADGSLGVDALWLSPFYRSPMADFGYDVSDHRDVDPVFGTLGDFDRLLDAAHARGLRVLVDLVLNHTSTRHPWFVESRSSRDNPKRDWYVWAPPKHDGSPPNNWLSAFRRVGAAWTLDDATGECYLHTFTPEQADLNWHNPEVRDAMMAVVRHWLDRGVDGFRVDVAHRIVKDAALRDNPLVLAHEPRHVSHPTARQHNADHPGVHDVLRLLRAVVDEYPGRVTLGEVPIHDHARLVRYFGDGDELHMVFAFALWDQPWSATGFRAAIDAFEAALPEWGWPCYALSNHDIGRVASRCASGGEERARARVAAMLLMTLRGTPCVYYGDEIGMTDVAIRPPWRALDVDGRDPARTPMQWDARGDGFGAARPWLPPAADAGEINVAAQRRDPSSTLSLYRALVRYRRASPALRRGSYESLDVSDDVFAFRRAAPGDEVVVALNYSGRAVETVLAPAGGGARVELSTHPGRAPLALDGEAVTLAPDEGVILRPVPRDDRVRTGAPARRGAR